MTRTDFSVGQIMQMTSADKLKVLRDCLNNPDTFAGLSYAKTLIFICGNLDSAYKMSGSVADADQDADILHKYSKSIDIVKIKNC